MRFNRFHSPFLRDPEPGEGGGGGGQGAGTPSPAFSEAQVAALKGLFQDFARTAVVPLADQIKALSAKLEKPTEPQPQPQPEPDPKTGGDGGQNPAAGSDLPPAVKAQLDRMAREVARLRQESEAQAKAAREAQERAEQAHRESTLSNVLAGYEFASEEARKIVVSHFLPQIQRAQDGTLVIGDLPVKDAVKNALEGPLAFALRPKTQGGTGVGAPAPGREVTLDDLRSNDPARRQAARAKVLALIQGR